MGGLANEIRDEIIRGVILSVLVKHRLEWVTFGSLRVQVQRGCAKRSSVGRDVPRATADAAGHCSGASAPSAAGVLLYFHRIANPPATAASHAAAAIHTSLEARLDLSEAGARLIANE